MTKRISLTQNQHTLVDDEDFDKLVQMGSWYARYELCTKSYYAQRHTPMKNGKRTTISMHRVIMNTPSDMQTDHINHNTLDNRKQNLRVCTRAENQHNTKLRKNTSSKYKGVSWDKIHRKWKAQIQINEKRISIGYFKSEMQTAKAYNKRAKELFGEFALLNKI